MNPTILQDVRHFAEDVQSGALHLARALDLVASAAPEPLCHQLAAYALAAELLSDKALIIQESAK